MGTKSKATFLIATLVVLFAVQQAIATEHVIYVRDVVDPKIQYVSHGDIVTWIVDNAAAHSHDTGLRFATTVRITFTGGNPTTGPPVNDAPIPPPGGGDAMVTVHLLDPLPPGTYPYTVEILDQYGNVMATIDPSLVAGSVVPCAVNCPAMDANGINPGGDNRSPDMNSDMVVNLIDLAAFAQAWPPGPYNYCADYNCDGVINLVDLSVFAQHYGHQGPQPGVCN